MTIRVCSMKKYTKNLLLTILFAFQCATAFSDEIPGIVPNIPQPDHRNVIVQLFNWKYKDIEKAIPALRSYGYSHIHVSPPQRSSESIDQWYARYQPVDYNEISGPLGNENEFRQMNDTADKYDIKIIVDIVINHMAAGNYFTLDSQGNMIDEKYPDFSPRDFHPYLPLRNWNDTNELVNGWIFEGGLPDLDTSSPGVRKKLNRYLMNLIAMGSDGFRIDAAIHISPDDLAAILHGIPADLLVFCEIANKDPAIMKRYYDKMPQLDFYDFTLLNTMNHAFAPGGDLRALINPAANSKALPGTKAVTFVTNHDIDRGAANPQVGISGSDYNIPKDSRHLAYAYILGRQQGLPYVFVDMKNPKPSIDAFPDETIDRPEILAGIRFHNLSLGMPERWLDNGDNPTG